MCVLIKDVCQRLPLELQCSLYQGQQVDVNQSVRGNYKTGFCGGTKSDGCWWGGGEGVRVVVVVMVAGNGGGW